MSDLGELCKYINKLSREKTFIIYQGERIPLKEEKKWLEKVIKKTERGDEVGLSAFVGNKVIGMCGISLANKIKKHVGNLGLSISKEYRGEGIGKILIRETLKESKKRMRRLKIVTLDVFGINRIACNLYNQIGFKEFALLPGGIRYKGKYIDEISMYKKVR
jgi:RimJ/RimL family protein N-acetyltransferase